VGVSVSVWLMLGVSCWWDTNNCWVRLVLLGRPDVYEGNFF
jgi:hypothetical protein